MGEVSWNSSIMIFFEQHAQPLVYEWRVGHAYDARKELAGVADEHYVVVAQERLHGLLHHADEFQLPHRFRKAGVDFYLRPGPMVLLDEASAQLGVLPRAPAVKVRESSCP